MTPAVRRDVVTVFTGFALNGALIGSWTSRIPALKEHLGADLTTLGFVFLCMGLGSLISMPLTGFVLKKLSPRVLCSVCVAGAILAFMVLTQITSIWLFALVYAFAGFCYGAWDVVINVQGSAVEIASGKNIMPALHGFWGLGMLIGAGLGALITRAGIALGAHILVVVPLIGIVALASMATWGDYRAAAAQSTSTAEGHSPRSVMLIALVIGVMMLCSTVGEGSASDWLALHMVEDRGTTAALGAATYTVYALFLTIGRLLGHLTIERFGRVRAIQVSGLITFVGVLVVIIAPNVALSFVGAALWGIGLAVVFPAGISTAGEIGGRHSNHTIAIVSTLAYGGFLIGPPLLGMIGQHWGLQRSFLVPAILALCFAVLGRVTRPRGPVGDPDAAEQKSTAA